MREKQEGGPIYPTTLDVVDYGDDEYQVVASVQTGDPDRDIFVLKNPQTNNVIRVKGAVFNRFPTTKNPGSGNISLRDEGVRVTGSLGGGGIIE